MSVSGSEFDDEEDFSGLYENGHWEWDEKTKGLEFISNANLIAEESWVSPPAATIGAADFKDDIDLVEQQRFKRIFSRKTCEGDIVQLQDIKDIVLYTAPPVFITPSVVHLMHLPGTERFLRALILYHQYYLQIADEMSSRMLEMEMKVRTPESDVIETIYKDNLEDLRLLITKEYSNFVTASGEYKKFHHMGPSKDKPSLSRKGNILFESLIRLSIQIVWLALGRKSFCQIELEMQRLFKTQKYNLVEHKLKSNYVAKMSPQERYVLFGTCLRNDRVMKLRSPLMNENTCQSLSDWRLLGLGTLKYPNLGPRLQYLQDALILPERLLKGRCVTVGILGLPRERFDTMLREIAFPVGGSSSTSVARLSAARRSKSRISRASNVQRTSSARKSIASAFLFEGKLIPDIVFPPRESEAEWLPREFPNEYLAQNYCDLDKRRKWMARATRLALKRARKARHAKRGRK